MQSKRATGGDSADGVWIVGFSPASWFASTPDEQGVLHTWTAGTVRAGEINYGNAWADFGLLERRGTSRYVAGLEFFPDWLPGDCGGSVVARYHASWAIAIGADGTGVARNWTGILVDRNGIAPGGYGIHLRGGITAPDAGSKSIKLNDHWLTGLDTTEATFTDTNSPAISLAVGHRVRWGTNAEIWFDGTNLKARVGGTTVNIV